MTTWYHCKCPDDQTYAGQSLIVLLIFFYWSTKLLILSKYFLHTRERGSSPRVVWCTNKVLSLLLLDYLPPSTLLTAYTSLPPFRRRLQSPTKHIRIRQLLPPLRVTLCHLTTQIVKTHMHFLFSPRTQTKCE